MFEIEGENEEKMDRWLHGDDVHMSARSKDEKMTGTKNENNDNDRR